MKKYGSNYEKTDNIHAIGWTNTCNDGFAFAGWSGPR